MVRSWLWLPPRVMSGSTVLLQLESLLMSVAQVTSKGQGGVHGLGCHQRPSLCCCGERHADLSPLRPWGHLGPGCCQGPCLGPRFYGSQGLCDVPGLGYYQRPCRCLWSGPLPEAPSWSCPSPRQYNRPDPGTRYTGKLPTGELTLPLTDCGIG